MKFYKKKQKYKKLKCMNQHALKHVVPVFWLGYCRVYTTKYAKIHAKATE